MTPSLHLRKAALLLLVGVLGAVIARAVVPNALPLGGIAISGAAAASLAYVLRQRPVSVGGGVMWGATYAFVAWLWTTGLLRLAPHDAFPQLVAAIVAVGVPAGLALGILNARTPERQEVLSLPRAIVGGGLAGVVGGWVFGKWMEHVHFFPLIAGIVSSSEPQVGVTLHFAIAVTIGVTFGLLFQREIRGLGSSLGYGAAYGIVWWFAGPLTLLPLFAHRPVDWSADGAAALFGSLAGHIMYGLIVGLTYAVVDGVWQRLFYESDPLHRERAEGAVRTAESILRGMLASVAGGLAFSIIMYVSGALPRVASLVGGTSLALGFAVHMAISVAIGATYGALFRNVTYDIVASLAWGMLYGTIWWFVGALTLFPILLGGSFTWTIADAGKQLPSLSGHVLYGFVTALAYVVLARSERDVRRRGAPAVSAPAVWLLVVGLGVVLPVLLS